MEAKVTTGVYDLIPATAVPNNGANDPAGCVASSTPNIGRFVMGTGFTQEGRELIAKTLLSAFLAGKQVQVEVGSSVCSGGGNPTYGHVRILE
jgi:hypothetical protein